MAKLHTVVCYKVKKPTIYNKGTKYEKSCDEFLRYYDYGKTVEQAQAEVDIMNSTHPEKDKLGYDIDWDEIDYFFVSQQEAFID